MKEDEEERFLKAAKELVKKTKVGGGSQGKDKGGWRSPKGRIRSGEGPKGRIREGGEKKNINKLESKARLTKRYPRYDN